MERIVILYSTVYGFTAGLCERLKAILEAAGHHVCTASIDDACHPLHQQLAQFDRIVIGASIRYGRHRQSLYRFIDAHLVLLHEKPSAFFTVNLVARKSDKDTPEGNPYILKFRRISPWQPTLIGVFAGQLDYASYGFWDRIAIRLIMLLTKGPTSGSSQFIFTDWRRFVEFGQAVLALPPPVRSAKHFVK